tara:strand:+ start:147 stop:359 length:213 start_codon:yes stop_codon:yes gene_type:complete
MPKHYGGKSGGMKKGGAKKGKSKMKPMTKQQHDMFLKAEKDGIITKKQHENLPAHLLEAIVKKKRGGKKK